MCLDLRVKLRSNTNGSVCGVRVLTLGVFILRYDYDRCQGSPTAAQKPEKLKTKSVQMKTKIPLISKNCWDEREKKRKTTFEMKTLKVKGWFVFFFAPGVVFFSSPAEIGRFGGADTKDGSGSLPDSRSYREHF